jgi:hypothetical protein
VTAYRAASVRAVCIVGVRVPYEGRGTDGPEDKIEGPGTFEVAKDMKGGCLVVGGVAIKERGETSNGKGNIRADSHSDVPKAPHQLSVRCVKLPLHNFRGHRSKWVRVSQMEAGHHGGLGGL